MEIEQTPIWQDALKIWRDTETPPRYNIMAMIHTKAENFEAFMVVTIDWIRDYTKNFADNGEIHLKMGLGEYAKRLYPYRNNLEITIVEREVLRVVDKNTTSAKYKSERYKAVFNREKNLTIKMTDFDNIDKFSLDNTQIIDVKLELVVRQAEALRLKTTGGSYNMPSGLDKTPEQVTRAIMSSESVKVTVDGKPAAEVLDIVPFDNKEKINQLVIPQHTSLSSVPTWMQEKGNGAYNYGMGTYLQEYKGKMTWFVYPLYDYNAFYKYSKPKIIFYILPARRVPFHEKTFRREDGVIHAIAHSSKKYSDTAEGELLADGSGYRMTDAKQVPNDPAIYEPDGPKGTPKTLNTETAMQNREDGSDFVPMSNRGIGHNQYHERSRIAYNAGARVDCVFDIADYRDLYPAMPCMFVFMEDKSVTRIVGVILGVHVYRHLEGQGVAARVHRTTCTIAAFTQPIRGQRKTEDDPVPHVKHGQGNG